MKKICVLKGGTSTEREVSLVTARSYSNSLKELGYDSKEFDFSGDVSELVSFLKAEKPDCVLNGLHGGTGENGNVQAVLNLMKLPYTHSGVSASAIAMDKHLSREIFMGNGIRVPKGKTVKWTEFLEDPDVTCPVVVKPIDGGSSAGVFIVEDTAMLGTIDWKYGDMVLVEEYIPGLELTVGVVDNKPLEVTNISVSSGFYDYHNKYSSGCSSHELPAKIPDNIRREALDMALKAHTIIGCRGVSRSDFRYNDVKQELYILELNTQPGMTPLSLLPEQAKFVGISFNQLVQWMIEEACYDI